MQIQPTIAPSVLWIMSSVSVILSWVQYCVASIPTLSEKKSRLHSKISLPVTHCCGRRAPESARVYCSASGCCPKVLLVADMRDRTESRSSRFLESDPDFHPRGTEAYDSNGIREVRTAEGTCMQTPMWSKESQSARH